VRSKILVILMLITLCYALALSISMLNQYLDRSPPHEIAATVDTKFTRHNPFPIDMLRVRLEGGYHANIAVLKETWSQLGIGSRIDVVEKRGWLSKKWYQDKAFYESLESGRPFQGVIHIGFAVLFMYLCFGMTRRLFPVRTAGLITVVSVIIAFSYFAVAL
jgi:hypothetical protein